MRRRIHPVRWLGVLAGLLALLVGVRPDVPEIQEPVVAEEDLAHRAVLDRWVSQLRAEGARREGARLGDISVRAAEMALGSPYYEQTIEAYLDEPGASPDDEPLTLRLDGFDCVTLVETALAAARVARGEAEGEGEIWSAFEREVERQRYRGGERTGYTSRLHYFSEWIADGEARGLLQDLGRELGGRADTRPLGFMTANRDLYPALRHAETFEAMRAQEDALRGHTRWMVPTGEIDRVADRIETGDVIAIVSSRAGLDVLHTGLAYQDAHGTLRMIHAPLSGGAVEVTRGSLQRYVESLRGSPGVLVARPS